MKNTNKMKNFRKPILDKIIFAIIFSSLMILSIGCGKEDDPKPFYEVVPVVEVTNAFFNDIYKVRLNNTLVVDNSSTTKTWDIQFQGARSGCNLLKWVGEPIEYIVGTDLEFNVQVLYDLVNDGQDGFSPVENFLSNSPIKNATWIRVYFEVRDKNNRSNKYLGIEEYNNPTNGIYQAPAVIWTVTDLNTIPSSGSVADQNSNLRVEGFVSTICEDCIWSENKDN